MNDLKDISPIYVEKEPKCTPQCPRHGLNGGGCWEGVVYCVPALRRDRDRLLVVLEIAEKVVNGLKFEYESLKTSWEESERLLATRFAARKITPARVERVAKAVEQCIRESSYLEERAENMDAQDWKDLYLGEAKKILSVVDADGIREGIIEGARSMMDWLGASQKLTTCILTSDSREKLIREFMEAHFLADGTTDEDGVG